MFAVVAVTAAAVPTSAAGASVAVSIFLFFRGISVVAVDGLACLTS